MTQPAAVSPASGEKRRIGACFAAAAASYDHAAALQREIGLALLDELSGHVTMPPNGRCLDLGCGTGFILDQLAARGVAADHLFGADLAMPMLEQGRRRRPGARWLCADAERLPFNDRSFELIISNLPVQWLDGLERFLAEAARTLRPGGWLAFTTLGTRTLAEFERLCRDAAQPSRVNRFITKDKLKACLEHAPLRLEAQRRSRHVRRYPGAWALMRELKQLGAHHLAYPTHPHLHARAAGLGGRSRLVALERLAGLRYPEGVPASYDTHFIILRKPD
ncbi:methyltransferase domain-containing protein [Halotalea alkalilenta]|uniref:methyltransferase domain-containing protein n=1 Tax=Halotalea alkalilenta TaxID=376489 RepID=UPI00048A1F63|nr:methyltransferase domain-containing protein [Halotalea alkalilenta]